MSYFNEKQQAFLHSGSWPHYAHERHGGLIQKTEHSTSVLLGLGLRKQKVAKKVRNHKNNSLRVTVNL